MWLDILIFAAIAAFFAYRLYQVLGQQDGDVPPTDLSNAPKASFAQARAERAARDARAPFTRAAPPADSLAGALTRIADADGIFDERQFIAGAKAAFTMIITAFAKGDREALRPLLEHGVFEQFSSAIATREAAGEKLETSITRITTADITSARLEGRNAYITVDFISEQVNLLRDAAGNVVDGVEGRAEKVEDRWTFTRDVLSADPNWRLISTGSL